MARQMTFEPSITLGGILGPIITAITFLGMYIAYHFKQSKNAEIAVLLAAQKFASIDAKLDSLSDGLSGIEHILRNQAVMTERQDNIEKLVDELRHGHGYVLPLEPHRRTFGPGQT